jgi:hypothetical protein
VEPAESIFASPRSPDRDPSPAHHGGTAASAARDPNDLAPHLLGRQPTLFDGVLEQSRELICTRLDEAIACMLDEADKALLAFSTETQNREERSLFEKARDVAMERRDFIETQFRARYREEFQQRSDRARKTGRILDQAYVPMDALELVGDGDLDETLKFNDMANKLRIYCEDELVALDQRVGVLLGDADLPAKDNPFSPQVICDAFKHACRELEVDTGVRRALLKLFDDHVLDDIRAVYKAVNALLVRNAILPQVRYSIARNQERPQQAPGAPGASGAAAMPGTAPATDMAGVSAQDLFAVLQRLATGNAMPLAQPGAFAAPVGAVGAVGAVGVVGPVGNVGPPESGSTPVLKGTELLSSLTRIQIGDLSALDGGPLLVSAGAPGTTNVLHQLKGTSVGAGMDQVDLLTLDIIAMLFDQLFDDPNVPDGVKALIGRLQIPMLKVAIADKSFFSTKSHPARRLLDTVGEIALRLPADFGASSPLFTRLQDILQLLIDGFQDDVEVFTQAREQLHALLAEEDHRIEVETRFEAKRVEEMENLALARSVAQEAVKSRVRAHNLPGPVSEFLAQQWLKLLLLIHVKEGKEGRAWSSALAVMDQLIWSVEPKATIEDQRRLGAMIPQLIRYLTAGMKSAGIDESVRDSFLGHLMKYHTLAIGTAGRTGTEPTPSVRTADSPPPQAAAPILQSAGSAAIQQAPPESLDFTAPITVRNPYGSGEVSVENDDLDFTAAAEGARARREESVRKALDTLSKGSWVEFSDPASPTVRRTARLIFVSPRGSRYLFATDRAGKETIQCTRAEVARRLRLGEVVRLDKPPEESLFDRIIGGLLGKLRGGGRQALLAQ